MAEVARVTAIWTGFSGAPGYTKISFLPLAAQVNKDAAGVAVRALFEGIKTKMLTTWSVQVQSIIQIHDVQTGVMLREDTMTAPPAVTVGTAASTVYTGGAGAMIGWSTGAVFNGRRVKGRTFLVPLCTVNDTDGTLSATTITALNAAAAALIGTADCDPAVWSRQMTKTTPSVQIGGAVNAITGYTVPDRSGILRSRRD